MAGIVPPLNPLLYRTRKGSKLSGVKKYKVGSIYFLPDSLKYYFKRSSYRKSPTTNSFVRSLSESISNFITALPISPGSWPFALRKESQVIKAQARLQAKEMKAIQRGIDRERKLEQKILKAQSKAFAREEKRAAMAALNPRRRRKTLGEIQAETVGFRRIPLPPTRGIPSIPEMEMAMERNLKRTLGNIYYLFN